MTHGIPLTYDLADRSQNERQRHTERRDASPLISHWEGTKLSPMASHRCKDPQKRRTYDDINGWKAHTVYERTNDACNYRKLLSFDVINPSIIPFLQCISHVSLLQATISHRCSAVIKRSGKSPVCQFHRDVFCNPLPIYLSRVPPCLVSSRSGLHLRQHWTVSVHGLCLSLRCEWRKIRPMLVGSPGWRSVRCL